jgi:hypothetical protein
MAQEEEIAQLMREVDLVRRLLHPSIVNYEKMARDKDMLRIVLLKCVVPFLPLYTPAFPLLRILTLGPTTFAPADTPRISRLGRFSRRSAI